MVISDAIEAQLQIPLNVNLNEAPQQPGASHFLEGLEVASVRRIRQKDDAPEIQRLVLGSADGMPDVEQWLKGAR